MKIKITRLALESIKLGSVILIDGKRGTGKTVLAKDLANHFITQRGVKDGFYCSPFNDVGPAELTRVKSFDDFWPQVDKKRLDSQKNETLNNEFHELNLNEQEFFSVPLVSVPLVSVPLVPTGNREDVKMIEEDVKIIDLGKTPLLYVFDQMLIFGNKQVERSPEMRDLLCNSRHNKETCIITTQYSRDIDPFIRSQFDVVFATWSSDVDYRRKLYSSFFKIFKRFEDFETVLSECTKDYCFLVVKNTINARTPEECIFFYKVHL